MQYLVLAADYDGTLAHDGHVAAETLAAVRRLRASGRRFILVTGRDDAELNAIFPDLSLCDAVVSENGAVVRWPGHSRETVFGAPPSEAFVLEMTRRGVAPFSVGRVIFATWRPHEAVVLEVIQQLGMEYQIVFNKRAVMVLPSGVNKATGLAAALEGLGLSDEQVVGIGDAENDHAFVESCAASVAVANAVPSLKEHCDFVTHAADGQGVVELIEHLLADDLQSLSHAAAPQRENMNKT